MAKKRKKVTGVKSLSDAITRLGKKFSSRAKTEVYSTGSLAFDKILAGREGNAGIPSGRLIELCGPAGLGKSTSCLEFCKAIIAGGKKAVYMDFENAVNDEILEGMGLTKHVGESLAIHKASTFSDLQDLVDVYMEVEDVVVMILDSITAVMPNKLKDVAIDELEPGLQARYVGNFYLKYKSEFAERNKSLIVVNQIRNKISFTYGTKEAPAGGMAQAYYMDIRIMMQSLGDIWSDRKKRDHDSGAVKEGVDIGVWTTKNKFNFPYIRAVASIIFGRGISNVRCLNLYAEEAAYVDHVGQGWYDIKIPGMAQDKVQGKIAVEKWFRDNYNDILEALTKDGWL